MKRMYVKQPSYADKLDTEIVVLNLTLLIFLPSNTSLNNNRTHVDASKLIDTKDHVLQKRRSFVISRCSLSVRLFNHDNKSSNNVAV